ncbi:MAG: hypothetical protein IPL78_22760 [Chloroflexi bacterium]|nr:hypothetical protein [Chloroflexota bacterium]
MRRLMNVEVVLITGECSPAVQQRAAKLAITELHEGGKDKAAVLGKQFCIAVGYGVNRWPKNG